MPPGVTDLRLGVGPALIPKYEGDNNTRLIAAPVLSARYKDIIALDGTQVRVNLLDLRQSPAPHPLSAGPMMKLDFGRQESNSRDLRGLGDVGTSFEMGGFVNYNIGPGRLRATIRQDIADGHRGAIGTVDAGLIVYRTTKLIVAAQTGVTWASGHYMQSYFGITPLQSARSGLPIYHPGSGLKSWSITAGGEYQLIQQWSLGMKVDYSRLMNGAANSPLVTQRGSPNQFSAGTFVIYSF